MILFAGSGVHPVFCVINVEILSPRINRPDSETDSSFSLGCETKNGHSCTSIPFIRLRGVELRAVKQ